MDHGLEYRHQSMYPHHNRIRILHLRPRSTGEAILCELVTEELHPRMERYSALSWKWGDRTRMAVIYIEGKIFEVRHNLFADLQQLRHPALTVRLWVDAICINQDDDSEKSVQIPLMPKIYGLAHSVCVWLGEAANDSHLAMVFLGRVANLDMGANVDRLLFSSHHAHEVLSLLKLLKRGCFGRRWVVQEIAVARSAIIYCGEDFTSWDSLVTAVGLFKKATQEGGAIQRMLSKHVASSSPSYNVETSQLCLLFALSIVLPLSSAARTTRVSGPRATPLEHLVSSLYSFQATRLHDTLYALLGLAADIKPAPPLPQGGQLRRGDSPELSLRRVGNTILDMPIMVVDYSLYPLEVFVRFITHTIDSSESLDIICRPWAHDHGFSADGATRDRVSFLVDALGTADRVPANPTWGHGAV